MSSTARGTVTPGARVPTVILRPRKGWQPLDFKELWSFRDLLWGLAVRDVKVRYKQTFLGASWAVVQPLVMVVVFTIFFGKLLNVEDRLPPVEGRVIPYAVFALSAQVLWQFFAASVNHSSSSLISNANLVRKIYFPRLLMPVAATASPAVDGAVGFGLLLVVMGYSRLPLRPEMVLFPLAALSTVVAALGVGLLMAALSVNYRDFKYVVPFLVTTWQYLTPVIWPIEIVPERYRTWLYLNPMVGPVNAFRGAVLGLPIDYAGWAISAAVGVTTLIVAVYYFARVERRFADIA